MKTYQYGPMVRRLRKERGITLSALAAELECSISYLSDVERSTRLPFDRARNETLARTLGVALDDLLRAAAADRGTVEPSRAESPKLREEQLAALHRGLETISEEERERFIQALKAGGLIPDEPEDEQPK